MASPVGEEAAVRPFRINVAEEDLDDLRRRIAATRWPHKELVEDRSQGVQLATLQEYLDQMGSLLLTGLGGA